MATFNMAPAIRALNIKLESCVVGDYRAFFAELHQAVDALERKYAIPDLPSTEEVPSKANSEVQ